MPNSIEELQRLAGMQAGMAQAPESPDQERIDRAVIGHRDDEKGMIKKQLLHAGSYSLELYKMLEKLPDDSDFPHWWQGKIVEAVRLLDNAKHYLEGEMVEMPSDVEEPKDEIDAESQPINESNHSGWYKVTTESNWDFAVVLKNCHSEEDAIAQAKEKFPDMNWIQATPIPNPWPNSGETINQDAELTEMRRRAGLGG